MGRKKKTEVIDDLFENAEKAHGADINEGKEEDNA